MVHPNYKISRTTENNSAHSIHPGYSGWMDFNLTCAIIPRNFNRINSLSSNLMFCYMKTKLLLSVLLPFTFYLLPCLSQVPQGFNYQAIARDSKGNPITNATIKVKLSILTDTSGFYASGSGTYLWEEEQTNVKTNAFGLFTVVFGDPSASKVQGSVTSFGSIDWSATALYIGVKVANPTDFKNMGASKLLSVPFAMVSAKVTNGVYTSGSYANPVWISSLAGSKVIGNVLRSSFTDSAYAFTKGSRLSVIGVNDGSTEALFEVKRKDGQTVFAVYPNSVNIYVPRTTPKGVKGGFAIGGFDGNKIEPQDYFRVTPDSVRVYIDKTPNLKGTTKGGFAIGGFDQVKGWKHDLLTVSKDSVRIYIDKTPAIKGATKGGFAIGGFDESKGPTQDLLTVSNDSIRMYINDFTGKGATKGGFAIGGFETGKGGKVQYLRVTQDSTRIITADTLKGFGVSNLSSGNPQGYLRLTPSNYFIGNQAGKNITTGKYNSFLGYETGLNNTSGSKNVFLGHQAGYTNTIGAYNVFIGTQCGYYNTQGLYNTFLGYQAGYNNKGDDNVFLGYIAGYNNTTGSSNVSIGYFAGLNNTTGGGNVFLGDNAGRSNQTGSYNVILGFVAGNYLKTGVDNVILGKESGFSNIDGQDNTFLGGRAGHDNKGSSNTMVGFASGDSNINGSYNVFLGDGTGRQNDGSKNVFIGYQAGSFETGSEKLYIDNSNTTSPLIFGDFTNGFEKIIINGNVGIGTSPSHLLHLSGGAYCDGTGAWISGSDKSFKKEIKELDKYGIKEIMRLRPITFVHKQDQTNTVQLGFLAQDIINIIPELVSGTAGNYGLAYDRISVVLVEAMKEQERLIEKQQSEIDHLKSLENEVSELKVLVNTLVANQAGKGHK
jgi:trimeric autotransporter adhesin